MSQYLKLRPSDDLYLNDLESGKLYELFVLGKVLKDIKARGYDLRFVGGSIKFKSSPGFISQSDPHFDVCLSGSHSPVFQIFTDIEFETLGYSQGGVHDNSSHHELDIAVVFAGLAGRPAHNQIALGVECKAHAKFTKSIVRQALGIRRELSLLSLPLGVSLLSQYCHQKIYVPAHPASEFWLAYIDARGNEYRESPSFFGIEFMHWEPK